MLAKTSFTKSKIDSLSSIVIFYYLKYPYPEEGLKNDGVLLEIKIIDFLA